MLKVATQISKHSIQEEEQRYCSQVLLVFMNELDGALHFQNLVHGC